MELRLWIGLHSCLQCFLLVVSDASYIIKYMTRFTEEGFSSLISFIFISDAIKKMVGYIIFYVKWPNHQTLTQNKIKTGLFFSQVGAWKYYPINRGFKPDYITAYKCECIAPDQGESSDRSKEIGKQSCVSQNAGLLFYCHDITCPYVTRVRSWMICIIITSSICQFIIIKIIRKWFDPCDGLKVLIKEIFQRD